MKLLSIILTFVFYVSCASNKVYVQGNVLSQYDYERQHRVTDKAFEELDKDIDASKILDNRSIDNKQKIEEQHTKYQEKERPADVEEKLRPSDCTYSQQPSNEQPCWILNPDCVKGYKMLAVGSAEKQSGGDYEQKKLATLQARGELSRIIKIYIENEIKITEKYDRDQYRNDYKHYFETQSRQRSESYINNITEIECYRPDDNIFYILLGVK